MENGNFIHDRCRWLTINNIDGNCPLFDSRNVPIKKKKEDTTTTTKQPTNGYILPLHSGTPMWFSSEGLVELMITILRKS